VLCSTYGYCSTLAFISRKPNHPCDYRCRDEGPFTSRSRTSESAYQACLAHEVRKHGLEVATQVPLPVIYDGEKLEVGYRVDLVVENRVVVEVKSVEAVHPIHEAQLLSYMRLSGINVGLLLNFNVLHMRNGIKRMVDGRDWQK
jgi:GxxExxY protein